MRDCVDDFLGLLLPVAAFRDGDNGIKPGRAFLAVDVVVPGLDLAGHFACDEAVLKTEVLRRLIILVEPGLGKSDVKKL